MMQGISRRTRHSLRRARRKRKTELNIVSMIDILTVLVFFLLVNSTGVSVLGINLPAPQSDAQKPPPHALSVVIRTNDLAVADNGTVIKNFPVTDGHYDLADLADLMQKIKQEMPGETKVTLLLAPNVAYDTLVKIMDTVRVQPTPDGRGLRKLFPDISVGDAPVGKIVGDKS